MPFSVFDMTPKSFIISYLLGQFFAIGAPVLAAPNWRVTHFGTCFSEDAIMQADGAWWYYEMGRGGGARYGGSFVTASRIISASQYGSRKGDVSYDLTGLRIRKADGSWFERFYLPIEYFDEICGSP